MTSKADQLRYDALVRYGCVCCRQLGEYAVPEIHHVLRGGRRSGNADTLPLCPYHHRGLVDSNVADHRAFRNVMGPSIADGSKQFSARWGTQRELLEGVNREIGA